MLLSLQLEIVSYQLVTKRKCLSGPVRRGIYENNNNYVSNISLL